MSVKELLEELRKLPPQTELQDIKIKGRYEDREVVALKWEGTHVALETR